MKRRGFTLVEMLVVIGIIVALMGVTLASVSTFLKSAEKARCRELVSNTATALAVLFQREGSWPKLLRQGHGGNNLLDEKAALPLAKGGYMTLTMNDKKTQLAGYDCFGIVTPWALAEIKRKGSSASLSTKVSGGGTIQDHILRYAIDLDGDGVIPGVQVGDETVDIRATAAVWCCGKDGKIEAYSVGQRMDDIYSWTVGQTRGVQK